MDNLFEYRRELDALRFTAEQKAALTTRVTRAAGAEQTRSRRPVRRTLVLAAAAALVLALGVGAGATVYQLASNSFAPVFGTAQTEIIDKIGRPIGASDTDAGVTITADAIIGDKYNACIIYSITQADGTPIELPGGSNLTFGDQTTGLRSNGGNHGSARTLNDLETGVIQYVEMISADEPLNLGRTSAVFEDLYYFDEATQERKLFLEGKWKLKFEVNFEDSAIALPAGQTFTRDGIGFTIDTISLSPVAVQVKYTADARPDWDEEESGSGRMPEQMSREQDRFLTGIPLVLTMTDGSNLDLTQSAGGGIRPGDDSAECTKGTVFEQIVPLEDVVSVTVGDVVIPVN